MTAALPTSGNCATHPPRRCRRTAALARSACDDQTPGPAVRHTRRSRLRTAGLQYGVHLRQHSDAMARAARVVSWLSCALGDRRRKSASRSRGTYTGRSVSAGSTWMQAWAPSSRGRASRTRTAPGARRTSAAATRSVPLATAAARPRRDHRPVLRRHPRPRCLGPQPLSRVHATSVARPAWAGRRLSTTVTFCSEPIAAR